MEDFKSDWYYNHLIIGHFFNIQILLEILHVIMWIYLMILDCWIIYHNVDMPQFTEVLHH